MYATTQQWKSHRVANEERRGIKILPYIRDTVVVQKVALVHICFMSSELSQNSGKYSLFLLLLLLLLVLLLLLLLLLYI